MTTFLFDRARAVEPAPYSFGVHPLEVLGRWAGPRAERLRSHTEHMLAAYPEEHRAVMWNRCDCKSASQANDAFFELFVHNLFVSRGYALTGLEEPLPNSPYSIDFTFRAPTGQEFLVEVVSYNKSKQLDGPAKLMTEMFSAIDDIASDVYEVEVTKCWGGMALAVGKRGVVHAVSQWLATLPLPSAEDAMAGLQSHDFHLTKTCGFTLAPRFRSRSVGHGGLVAGIQVKSSSASVVDGIRRKLHQKAFKYGRLRLPLVLALNVSPDLVADAHLFERAVYGPASTRVDPEPYTGHPNGYVPNCGALVEAGGPLSLIPAVLGFVGVNPLQCLPDEAGSYAHLGRLYHSKYAANLDLDALGLPQRYAESAVPHRIEQLTHPRRRYPRVSLRNARLLPEPGMPILVMGHAA